MAVSDSELVARAQAGHTSAFEELLQRHAARVHAMASQMCRGHAHDAEETSQNAFLKAYQKLGDFRREAQFSTWLTSIVINECLMHHRRHGRELHWLRLDEELAEEEDLSVELADHSHDPEEEYARHEFQATLERCLTKLPESYREPFVLKYVEGLSGQELATRLGLSLSATKSRLYRARLQLQHCLSERFCRDGRCYWPGASLSSDAVIDR